VTSPGDFSISPFDGDSASWDRCAAAAVYGTFCHLAGWRRIMADVLGHECVYLVALDRDGTWAGLLPLVRVRSRLFGHYLVSLPFLSYGGPIGEAGAQERLAAEALAIAARSDADLLELRTRHAITGDLRPSLRKIAVVLELPDSAAALWTSFPSKLRSQIRRPLKEEMDVRFGREQLHAFYDVYARTMHGLGTPALPGRFFEDVAATFGAYVDLGAVYLEGLPVAAGFGFHWRDEFELTWAGSLRALRPRAPNMLLYWAFMERMIGRGTRRFNFGRSTPGGGAHRFKEQWGGVNLTLPWLQWSPRRIDQTPSPERPVYRMARAAWRRLPLSVANRLGPRLARQLP